ncbi:MAG: helix-turn-helix domain-containing protein [Firmicutes bacterium]|nr:helix-turn-helix domain-containing protein [Bacillota bacterium]
MSNLEIAIGGKIKLFRKNRGITQEQLADYLNISFQSVSKWECGDAYPDITMLPKIAMFFGVTTDELLCIDKLKEQEEIAKYRQRRNDALAIGHTKQAVAIMREVTAKYPGNYELMYLLAYTVYTDSLNPRDAAGVIDRDYQQNAWKEIISIGEKVLAECKNNDTRTEMIEVMCYALRDLGEREKAAKLIRENLGRLWVSRERMLAYVLEDNELLIHRQQTLVNLTELLSWEMWDIAASFEPKGKFTVLENIFKLYAMIFTDGNYGYYHIKLLHFRITAMHTCLELGDYAKALENLKNAAHHAITFDQLAPGALYTSPLTNKLCHKGTIKNYKGNESYNLLMELSNEKYDGIRRTPEFTEICTELEKYAAADR